MAKAKQGDLLSCTECGLIVEVYEACGCAAAEIMCCEAPMAKGKPAADRARKKAAAKAAPSAAKAGKAVAASKAVKASAKPKAAAKKAPAKKGPARKTAKAAKK
ncbi:MAG TPA: hypothetical protein VJZ49_05395 [Syntrophales bacterium]|nr:hypothetical protein [Syntrophales bacterium]